MGILGLAGRAIARGAAARSAGAIGGRGTMRAGRRGAAGGLLGDVDFMEGEVGDEGGDIDRINEALATAMEMVGNEGQMSIVERASGAFQEWGMTVLESEYGGGADVSSYIIGAVGTEQYSVTDEIWDTAADIVRQNFGVHDGGDEMGEGTGN